MSTCSREPSANELLASVGLTTTFGTLQRPERDKEGHKKTWLARFRDTIHCDARMFTSIKKFTSKFSSVASLWEELCLPK